MERRIEVRVVRELPQGLGRPVPAYATSGSAALDLRACLAEPVTLAPGGRLLVPTGIAINLVDPGLVAIVASRSGLSLKHGVRVAQGIGVIDADYHGEIAVILAHDGDTPYVIQPGERIAQLMVQPVVRVALDEVEAFSNETQRGAGGFGSTGRA